MKRFNLIWAAIICLFVGSACMAHDKIIPVTQLPAEAQTFIKTYFADKTVAYCKKDYEGMGYKYEVKFNDGTEVDFDKKGVWDKVDCKFAAVPAALVPEIIANYVTANYPGASIVKIDKERYGYEIELSNDLELKFDRNGNLFDIDD